MEHLFKNIKRDKSISILDANIPISEYYPIDLSDSNKDLDYVNISNPEECQNYIDLILKNSGAKVAYGGYLERRNLYKESQLFSGHNQRNIHLGLDFWCSVGTEVLAPLDGRIHSFKNNSELGDYGPTIILEHSIFGEVFYSLYGHLSVESLEGLLVGQEIKANQTIANLGRPEINVNYAPHLHFQLVMDIEGYFGDYPGVCRQDDLEFYSKNCPNPNLLLGL
ncbi:peptidoglycan DD-metalloendopeptidase family protein [Croceivirga thetidis]|uniref:Peptidoglycan DD-metalloendopeptidase family protein n=1 Tax=Croceivirga thetidis TaxID=2721623 RepID=A0ABX1GSG1_9FLAO|nr:peptidoglycan DD-metalloendopeptidase family protein [Croceivirga thetidis]NKI32885.1 peptidoglycan DD-metalloendopeptidase family protein [Croceivirga thetidis]